MSNRIVFELETDTDELRLQIDTHLEMLHKHIETHRDEFGNVYCVANESAELAVEIRNELEKQSDLFFKAETIDDATKAFIALQRAFGKVEVVIKFY